jgi:coatomer subunit beta'
LGLDLCCFLQVGFLSSETSKLFGAYAAGASFDSNKETIRCPVTLTNKTEHYVGIWVKPTNEQFTRTAMILEPHSSLVVSVTMKAHESPQDTVKIEALMIVLQSKHDLVELESSIGGKLTMDSGFMAHTKKLQADVYWATLPAIICEPARCPQV